MKQNVIGACNTIIDTDNSNHVGFRPDMKYS